MPTFVRISETGIPEEGQEYTFRRLSDQGIPDDEGDQVKPVRFVRQPLPPVPAEGPDIEQLLQNPTYPVTEEEFRTYRDYAATKPGMSIAEGIGVAGQAAADIAATVAGGIKSGLTPRNPFADPLKPALSLAEGAARGTYDLGMMGRGIMDRTGYTAKELNEDQFIAVKLAQVNEQAFPKGLSPVTTRIERKDVPDATLEQWRREHQNYTLRGEYDRFLEKRAILARREAARTGAEPLLGVAPERIDNPLAEAGSLVLDPTLVVPGTAPLSAAGRVATRTAGAVGRAAETAGRAVGGTIDRAAENIAERVANITGTEISNPRLAGYAAAGAAAIGLPSLGPAIGTAAAVRTGAAVTEKAGQATAAMAEKAALGPTQLTLLEQIAKDESKPRWLRQGARGISGTGLDRAARLGAVAVRGATEGAAVGAGLGAAAEGEQGFYGGLGSGAALGAAGGLAADAFTAGSRNRAAEDADLQRWLASELERGTPSASLAKLNRDTALAAATAGQIFGSALDIRFTDSAGYRTASRDGLGAAFYRETPGSRPEIVVNVDAIGSNQGNFLHELGHALFKSPVVDKTAINLALHNLYGEAGLNLAGDDYARRYVINQRERNLRDVYRGNVPEAELRKIQQDPTPDQLAAARQELSAADPDWVMSEIFAEQFLDTTWGQNLNRLRKGKVPVGSSADALQWALVHAKANTLSALGVPLDPRGTGAIPPRLFRDFRIQSDPKLRKMIVSYIRDRDRFLTGIDAPKDKDGGVRVTPRDLANHPAGGWEWNSRRGQFENDWGIKLANGEVILKPTRDVAAAEAKRVEDVQGMFPDEVLPTDDPSVGRKRDVDGKVIIRGRVLPDRFFGLDSFSPETLRVARQIQDSMDKGEVFHAWYQAIGTGSGNDTWAGSVKRGLGNMRVSQRDFKPLSWQVSGQGNLLATVLDVTATLRKAVRWQSEGKLNAMWGGDLNAFRADLEQYLRNHADGQPGHNLIGMEKKNALNSFFGVTAGDAKSFNPLKASLRGDDRKSLVKSFRIDRMQNVKPTGQSNFWFDYEKQRRNLMPEKTVATRINGRIKTRKALQRQR